MTNALVTKWTIGRSRDSDVVVDEAGVEARHCEFVHRNGSWSAVPLDGQVGVMARDQNTIQWSRERMQIAPADSLWLTNDVKLPWPSETDARACLTVGRASDGDIVLPSSHISGRHALLIAGQNGTWVLRDLESRNGVFVDDDFTRRNSAVMLRPGRSIYLGSERIDVNELVAKAKVASPASKSAAPAQSEVRATAAVAPPTLKIKPAIRRSSTTILKNVLSALVPSVFAIGVWWIFMRPSANPVSVEQTQSYEEQPPAEIIGAAVPPVVQPAVPAIETIIEQPKPSESVYWVLIRHNESGNYFRLGSAVAVSADTVLTTASIVQAIVEMKQSGYSAPSIIQLTSGRIFEVSAHGVLPEFTTRTQKAKAFVADYERLVADVGDDAKKAAKSRDDLNKKAELVNVAMAATAAVDVGWLNASSLTSFLTVDTSAQYRPSQSLDCLAAGFDAEDPFYLAPLKTVPSSKNMRVKSVDVGLDGFAGVITVESAGAAAVNLNLIGSPLVHDDRLIGMIVFQDSERETIEAVSASVIAKALPSKTPPGK